MQTFQIIKDEIFLTYNLLFDIYFHEKKMKLT